MNVCSFILSPILLTFFVIAAGLCIGKLKLFHISLDLAAVLLVAVAVGYVIDIMYSANIATEQMPQIRTYMKMFSSLGTSLFVSVIGLTTGYSINSRNRDKIAATIIGMLMVASACITMWIILQFDCNISKSNLFGILCGALTTTPGLSVVYEKKGMILEEVTLGYGSAYLFGVIFTVLTVQIITRSGHDKPQKRSTASEKAPGKAIFGGLLQTSLTIILGNLIGGFTIPGINFSLGNSGGMLFSGIIIGAIVGSCFCNRYISKEIQTIMRNLGLVLFFVGNGIPAGMQLKDGFTLKAILFGMILTIIPILTGWSICRIILKKSRMDTAAIISGGMTSTPAIGVLASKGQVPYGGYSFSYTGALLMIVLLIRAM